MSSVKQITRNFLDFIGYSNLFLAFAVFCSTLQGGFIFEHAQMPAFYFSVFNFITAYFLYNLQRIYQSTHPTTDVRLLWYRKNRKWIFTIALLFLMASGELIWMIFDMYKQGMFVYGICAFLSILYFLPPLNLRRTKFLKQFYIALVWVMVCIIIPFMFTEEKFTALKNFGKDEWLYLISQFCFIASLCIPFDIRDLEKDREEGTYSLPVSVGIKNSKWIAIVLVLIYFTLSFFIKVKSLVVIRGMVSLCAITIIWYSKPERHRYYYTYLADGVIIVQTMLLYLLL